MKFVTSVTQKGQITLPISFRKQLSILPYSKVVLELLPSKKSITVEATEDILDLAGTFLPRANKKKSVMAALESMEDDYSST
jgi:bifunctional DNA-binding transcriptional regulator/antitoxin component of YhaV-PrlF toxin-antitoxin module